ncbi:hypothetical protein [Streptococcus pluranimalium]|uniref:hypothetical protein n=1 Tax=Streptococcus pluranimalium TaxID=82348 RepID=UPI00313A12E4
MKRTLKLRGMQLLDHLKIAALIMLVFVLFVASMAALAFFFGDNSDITIERASWVTGSLQSISGIVSIWTVIVFFTDGMSDFDSALRFGNKRKNYFIANFFIYAIITAVSNFFTFFADNNRFPSWQDFLSGFGTSFAGCFVIAIFGFAIYKWGWKLIFILLAINFLGGIAVAMFGLILRDNLPVIFETLSQLPDYAYKGIGVLILLALISVYYWIIAKVEVK